MKPSAGVAQSRKRHRMKAGKTCSEEPGAEIISEKSRASQYVPVPGDSARSYCRAEEGSITRACLDHWAGEPRGHSAPLQRLTGFSNSKLLKRWKQNVYNVNIFARNDRPGGTAGAISWILVSIASLESVASRADAAWK